MDFCLVVVKFDFVVSHTFLYIIGAKTHRVSEVRKVIGSSKVVELVIVSIIMIDGRSNDGQR